MTAAAFMLPEDSTFRASRHWHGNVWLYVSETPGKGGRDWGYTAHPEKAARLSAHHARRFRTHCRHVGAECSIVEVAS